MLFRESKSNLKRSNSMASKLTSVKAFVSQVPMTLYRILWAHDNLPDKKDCRVEKFDNLCDVIYGTSTTKLSFELYP